MVIKHLTAPLNRLIKAKLIVVESVYWLSVGLHTNANMLCGGSSIDVTSKCFACNLQIHLYSNTNIELLSVLRPG